MNAKSASACHLAAGAAVALVMAITLDAQPAAAQYGRYTQLYGRSTPYYERDGDYDRPSRYGRESEYGRQPKRDAPNPSRSAPGAPLLAVVALNEQRVTIYNAQGKILQAPVSTGATGLETPAGIYSVVQKEEFHQSNVYQDGNMPFMQRITWTGIALHAGVLPGQPASHGCVRMPLPFAQQLFGLTEVGLRVVVVREDIAPADISHPALFKPNPVRREASLLNTAAPGSNIPPGSAGHLEALKAQAATKKAEADTAAKTAAAAKQAAARKSAEAANTAKNLRAAEATVAKAQELLKGAEQALTSTPDGATPPGVKQAETAVEKAAAKLDEVRAQPDANTEKVEAKLAEAQAQLEAARQKAVARLAEAQVQREANKQKAQSKLAEAQTQLEAAKTKAQARSDEAAQAEQDAKAAEAARELVHEASLEASRKTSPVSVFISRKTQRLYVRQGYIPVFEGPVTIRDADKPIGSYVFTAHGSPNNAEVHWNVVSMYKAAHSDEPSSPTQRRRGEHSAEVASADVTGAKAALDRIAMPPDVIERFSDVVLPGASLIISDEGASIETGKDTDFVVLMSGEPQGGIKTRHREQPRYRRDRDDDSYSGGGSFFSIFN